MQAHGHPARILILQQALQRKKAATADNGGLDLVVFVPALKPAVLSENFLRFSNTFDVIFFASISAMRPKGDGMMLGMPRTLLVSESIVLAAITP